MDNNSKHDPISSSSSFSLKSPKAVAYPYRVICDHCRKIIFFSGENGEVFSVTCDKCSGL